MKKNVESREQMEELRREERVRQSEEYKKCRNKVRVAFLQLLMLLPLPFLGLLLLESFLVFSLGVLLFLVVFILQVWHAFAPANLSFTFVEEGTYKVFRLGKKVVRVVLQWSGHILDPEGNVIPERVHTCKGLEVVKGKGDYWYFVGMDQVKKNRIDTGGIDPPTEVAYYHRKKKGFYRVGSKPKPGNRLKVGNILPPLIERKTFRQRLSARIFGSLYWVGVYPFVKVYEYPMEYWSVEGDELVFHPKRMLDFVPATETIYWFPTEDAEDKNLVPLIIDVALSMRISNAFKALFVPTAFLQTAIGRLQPAVRDKMTEKPFKDLIQQSLAISETLMNDLSELDGLVWEYHDVYGLRVRAVEVKDIRPQSQKLRDASTEEAEAIFGAAAEVAKAEGDKQAKVIRAEGEKEALVLVGEGEAQRIRLANAAVTEFGSTGALVRIIEGYEKGNEGQTIIPLIPTDVMNSLGKILGEFTGDTDVSPEKLKIIKDVLKGSE